MLTRRVRGRELLLHASKRTNRVVRYVLAVIAPKWSVKLHAVTVMGNHWHVCLTDPLGNIVEFQRDCHQFITRGVNAHHGEFESLWASDQSSRLECQGPDDLIGRIAYTMANPVEAGLLRYGKSWPGVRSAWPCKPRTIRRPPKFFRGKKQGGKWPEEAVLELTRPPGYDELSDDELSAVIGAAIEEREAKFRAERDAAGLPFLGRRQLLAQSRHDRPLSREPRFGISPRVACRNKWLRIERLRANRQWAAEYRLALESWRAGNRHVLFPAGTYKMRVVHGAHCAETFG